VEKHTTAAIERRPSLFLSPSESSEFCKLAPPRSGRSRPPLELLLVRGGGAEQPPSICITAVEFFFPCVEFHRRAIHLLPPVSFESSPR
jgi:hypothetical protein